MLLGICETEWDIDELLRVLDERDMDSFPERLSLDWKFLAQGAATQIGLLIGEDDNLALKWSRVAVRAYEYSVVKCGKHHKLQRLADEESAMNIRIWAIKRFGVCPGDAVLDPARLEHWFRKHLPKLARTPRRLEVADFANEEDWSWHRDCVLCLLPLLELEVFPPESELVAWLRANQPEPKAELVGQN